MMPEIQHERMALASKSLIIITHRQVHHGGNVQKKNVYPLVLVQLDRGCILWPGPEVYGAGEPQATRDSSGSLGSERCSLCLLSCFCVFVHFFLCFDSKRLETCKQPMCRASQIIATPSCQPPEPLNLHVVSNRQRAGYSQKRGRFLMGLWQNFWRRL